MIVIDPIKEHENFAYSMFVTYPKTTQISTGCYDNKVDMLNMINMIKGNIKERNVTNVKGGKTDWDFFNNKKEFNNFLNYLTKKYRDIHPAFDSYKWLTNIPKIAAWGNELKKGEHVKMHIHNCFHIILYLTEGAPLVIPELKITIKPKMGSFYIFDPYLLHGVPEVTGDETRYNLVINLEDMPNWELSKTLLEKEKIKNSV